MIISHRRSRYERLADNYGTVRRQLGLVAPTLHLSQPPADPLQTRTQMTYTSGLMALPTGFEGIRGNILFYGYIFNNLLSTMVKTKLKRLIVSTARRTASYRLIKGGKVLTATYQ
ncbi:MAG: hypothetical protein AMS22_07795 [Thiotrichales bacterium SG8_50]|nr:MAG: hypothetical protein AMS22_07795 [Thiotrichales bacterium SG8_50]